nr:MFS transporter [Arthrobacter ulcerisalmonis]
MAPDDQPAAKGRFARLPHLAGRSFLPIGLFARLPLAMLTVGTLTLVTSVSGSYAVGGSAAGAVGIGSAVGAPVLGALADKLGQRPVLLVAAILNTVAVLAVILAAVTMGDAGGFPLAVLIAAFLAGGSCPQVGPLARVRWMALTSRGKPTQNSRDLDTALSYEGTADEVTFVLGPALVGILASAVAPWLPLAVAAAMTITLVPAFASHPTHQAVPVSRRATKRPGSDPGAVLAESATSSAPAPKMPWTVALPVVAMVCMGTFFGSTQAALSAFSAGFGGSELAGLLYAVMGLSSAVAALSVAYWSPRFTLQLRWLLAAAAMAVFAVLLLLPSSLGAMVVVLLVLGIPVGPVMVTVFSVGGKLAPARRLGTVMTALASGIVAGTALGSSIGGGLAQSFGYSAAFLTPVAAAVALALLGAGAAVVLGRRGAR